MANVTCPRCDDDAFARELDDPQYYQCLQCGATIRIMMERQGVLTEAQKKFLMDMKK